MANKKTRKGPEKVQTYHVKERNMVIVVFYDGCLSGTLEITPEQAIEIGKWGELAKVYREQMEEKAVGEK